ncbi:MAG: PAS domain S-box protein, partial [Candidatus Binatia bacterium]|nr:PAS domain S-box protein [Candidatus Binatia bacterium]
MTRDEISVATGYRRSELTGWTVAIAIPVSQLEAAAKTALLYAAGGGLLLMLLSAGLAVFFGRKIAASVAGLANAAKTLIGGDPAAAAAAAASTNSTSDRQIAEVTEVARAIEDAAIKRQRAEVAVRASEQRLREIIDGLGPQMFVGLLTTDGKVIEANRPALAAAGLKLKDVLGKPVEQTYWFAYSESVQRTMREAIESAARGEPSRYDIEIRVAESQFIVIDFSLQPLRDETGKVAFLVPSANVITERKRAEELLNGQKQVLEMIAVGASLPETLTALVRLIEAHAPGTVGSVLILDEDGVHVRHGAAPGLPPEYVAAIDGQPIGPRAGSCGTAAYRKEAVFVQDIATDPLWAEYRAAALPHGLRACWSTPILDEQGRVLGTFAIYCRHPALPQPEHVRLIDVATHTAAIAISRYRTQAALHSKTDELDRYFNSSLDLLCISDTEGYFRKLNPEWERTLGYPLAELEGRRFLEFVHPDDQESTLAALGRLSSQDQVLNFVNRYRHRDGSYRWIEWRSYAEDSRIYAVARDISERKRAEEALRASEERYRTLVEQAADAIFVASADGRFQAANRRASQMFGYSPEELAGMPITTLVDDSETQHQARDFGDLLASNYVLSERAFRRKDGSLFPGELSARRLADGRVLSIVRDITNRKRAEEALRASEERLRLALEAADMGTFDWEIPQNRILWSSGHEKLWGFAPGEFGGTYEAFSERVHPDDLPSVNAEVARCIAARETFACEFRVVWPD